MKNLNYFFKKANNLVYAILSSNYFLYTIVAFFIVQALWIAFSFNYPLVYDEGFHFNVIKIFNHEAVPFIINQPEAYDIYGNLSFGSATIYHYLMSFPYGFVSMFTDVFGAQVIALRIVNIIMVAVGLLIFSYLFRSVSIRQIYINISLLILTLLPITPFIAATINYDNLLFPLTAWFFLICVKILQTQAKNINWTIFAQFIIAGCLGSLVKYSFLPIFAISIIYIWLTVFKGQHKQRLKFLSKSFKSSSKVSITLILIPLIIVLSFFSYRYLYSIVEYGSPRPNCQKIMTEDRCLKYFVNKRNAIAKEKKEENTNIIFLFSPFSTTWIKNNLMLTNSTSGFLYGKTTLQDLQNPLPIMDTLVFLSVFGGIGVLFYSWRTLPKQNGWQFLFIISFGYVASVFINNLVIFLEFNQPYAIQPRYLLLVGPIFIVMILLATNTLLGRFRWVKLVLLIVFLMALTQGGGIITHILRSSTPWYWQNETVIKVNEKAQKLLAPIIKDH